MKSVKNNLHIRGMILILFRLNVSLSVSLPGFLVFLAMAVYTGVTINYYGKRFGNWRFSWSYIIGWVSVVLTFFSGKHKTKMLLIPLLPRKLPNIKNFLIYPRKYTIPKKKFPKVPKKRNSLQYLNGIYQCISHLSIVSIVISRQTALL